MGKFVLPKGTTTELDGITPDEGELLFDSTLKVLKYGDGTAGGNTVGSGATPTQAAAIASNTAAIVVNTAKTGITTEQAAEIVVNNAKTGLSSAQVMDISDSKDITDLTPTSIGSPAQYLQVKADSSGLEYVSFGGVINGNYINSISNAPNLLTKIALFLGIPGATVPNQDANLVYTPYTTNSTTYYFFPGRDSGKGQWSDNTNPVGAGASTWNLIG